MTTPLDWRFLRLRAELDEVGRRVPYACGGPAYALFGSAVMEAHGLLDRPLGDVDVFVPPECWQALAGRLAWSLRLPDPADPPYLTRREGGIDVHAFYRWTAKDPEVNADHCRLWAERVGGWWCAPLAVVRTHKVMSAAKHPGSERHLKHLTDVERIDAA